MRIAISDEVKITIETKTAILTGRAICTEKSTNLGYLKVGSEADNQLRDSRWIVTLERESSGSKEFLTFDGLGRLRQGDKK